MQSVETAKHDAASLNLKITFTTVHGDTALEAKSETFVHPRFCVCRMPGRAPCRNAAAENADWRVKTNKSRTNGPCSQLSGGVVLPHCRVLKVSRFHHNPPLFGTYLVIVVDGGDLLRSSVYRAYHIPFEQARNCLPGQRLHHFSFCVSSGSTPRRDCTIRVALAMGEANLCVGIHRSAGAHHFSMS